VRAALATLTAYAAAGQATLPATASFVVAFQVPSPLIHGPAADAPPPLNAEVHENTYPTAGVVDEIFPSPLGIRVASMDALAAVAVAVGAVATAAAAVRVPFPPPPPHAASSIVTSSRNGKQLRMPLWGRYDLGCA
jgi:hypothetical protein